MNTNDDRGTPNGMAFSAYELVAQKTATYKDADYLPLGLAEEVGELIHLFGAAKRKGTTVDQDELISEVGDVLWVLSQIARENGFWLDHAAMSNMAKLRKRDLQGTIHDKTNR